MRKKKLLKGRIKERKTEIKEEDKEVRLGRELRKGRYGRFRTEDKRLGLERVQRRTGQRKSDMNFF